MDENNQPNDANERGEPQNPNNAGEDLDRTKTITPIPLTEERASVGLSGKTPPMVTAGRVRSPVADGCSMPVPSTLTAWSVASPVAVSVSSAVPEMVGAASVISPVAVWSRLWAPVPSVLTAK